jgi:hypothetical protein
MTIAPDRSPLTAVVVTGRRSTETYAVTALKSMVPAALAAHRDLNVIL